MLLSLKWLSKYVDLNGISLDELLTKITAAGLEVEGVRKLASGSNLVVGQILEVNKIEGSDHLSLLSVDVKDEVLSIVCGAPNVRKNAKVIVAKNGAYLDAIDLTIKKSKIRGVESNGMCCSLSELGVDPNSLSKSQLSGIEILDDDAVVGDTNPLAYLGLDDTIIDIDITPDRGDLLSMWGLASDIAAILGKRATLDEVTPIKGEKSDLEVVIETTQCDVFSVRKVSGIEVKESPKWLKQILLSNNFKPINNIVDLGNYIMLVTGQPLHMYDYDKLTSNKFIIKDNIDDNVKMLDEKDYKIETGDICITNDNKVECLGGVIGSFTSMIDKDTKNLVIEAASFNGTSIRKTSRRLDLQSESSKRFIRGTDKYNTRLVLDFTINLLSKLTTVASVGEIVEVNNLDNKKAIELPVDNIEKLLGIKISEDKINEIFTNLGFKYTLENNAYKVSVPTRRNDLTIKEDLIEEIIRIYGFDNIPYSLPVNANNIGGYSLHQSRRNKLKDYLISNGLNEVVTYNLTSKSNSSLFEVLLTDEVVSISNPLTEDRKYLRKSLIPSLLECASYNKDKASTNVSIFEVSKLYDKNNEKELLSILINKNFKSIPHLDNYKLDYSVIKGFLEGILNVLMIDYGRLRIEQTSDLKQMHPYRSAKLYLDNKLAGFIGQVHPGLSKNLDDTYVLELDLGLMLDLKSSKIKYGKLSIYPSTSRDIAMMVKKEVESQSIINIIKRISRKLIKDVTIFDVYEGEHIEEGHKSIAVSITYNSDDKTLSDNEVNELHAQVINDLIKKLNVVIR